MSKYRYCCYYCMNCIECFSMLFSTVVVETRFNDAMNNYTKINIGLYMSQRMKIKALTCILAVKNGIKNVKTRFLFKYSIRYFVLGILF